MSQTLSWDDSRAFLRRRQFFDIHRINLNRHLERLLGKEMGIFHNSFTSPGHDATLHQLEEIIEEYRRACYATGKRVDQPHLRELARRAICTLSPFYSERDADRLLERAIRESPAGTPI
jgi:hypothetical protein